MKMVSVAKLKKATNEIEFVTQYSRSLLRTIARVQQANEIWDIDPENNLIAQQNHIVKTNLSIFKKSLDASFLTERENLPELIIAISPDKGLCGSLNTNIINNLNKKIALYKQSNKAFYILPLGKKIWDYCLAKHKNHIVKDATKIELKTLNNDIVANVSQQIISMLDENFIGSASVIYAKFTSVIKQDITSKFLVPFVIHNHEDGPMHHENLEVFEKHEVIFEPSIEEVISSLVVARIKSAIFTFVKHTEASEHGARMVAMDNATKNSEKVIKSLKLKYNRGRQSAITSQILEIVGGMEAVS